MADAPEGATPAQWKQMTYAALAGKPFEAAGLPDTPALRARYAETEAHVRAAAARGHVVDVPHDDE